MAHQVCCRSRRFTTCRVVYPPPLAMLLVAMQMVRRVVLCTFILFATVTAQSLDPAERAALVDLYISTSGSTWTHRQGWSAHANATSDPCSASWFGVTCTSDPTVKHVEYVALWGGGRS